MHSGNQLKKILFLILPVLAGVSKPATAQVSIYDSEKRGSIYVTVGSSTPSYRPSTINITQGTPSNLSVYTLDKVAADANSISQSSGLMMNVRLGYFFDYWQVWALELSYDPIKYHVTDGQKVRMQGTLENNKIDTSLTFSKSGGYFYNIDGANQIAINLVRRFQIFKSKTNSFRFDALAKAGGGPVMPHVFNSIAGKTAEYPSFQLGGWNVGGEAALRLTIMRYAYLEAGYRYSYASYTDIGVYNGSATQKLTTTQVLVGAGITFPTTKHNPLFKKTKEKWPLTIKPIYHEQPEPEPDMSSPEPSSEPSAEPTGKSEPSPTPEPSPEPAPEPTPAPEEPR